MKYVFDASVAIKHILPEQGSDAALELQNQFLDGVHELIAPATYPIEIAHALAKAERRKILDKGQAANSLNQLLTYPPVLFTYLPLLSRAMEIAGEARIGVYDGLYVALAEQEGCDLIAADERLVRNLAGYPIVLLGPGL